MMDKEQAREHFEYAIEHEQQEFEHFFLAKFFGLKFSYGEETCRIDLESKDFMFNPQGSLHGGVISFILDVSMGHLCKRFLGVSTTLEMKVQFLRPVFTGPIYCEASFIKKGKTIVALQSQLFNEKGQLAAIGTSTWYRLE